MLDLFVRNWWSYALRGVAAIIFGVLAVTSPWATLLALVLAFSIYAIADGALAIIAALHAREGIGRWVVLLEGLAGCVIGIVTLVYPQVTATLLSLLIALWAVFTGFMEIIAAVRLRREITNEWALILSGVISVILGVVLVAFPASGALAMIWTIGFYAIFFGVLMLYLAFTVRGLSRQRAAQR